jgi:hypothetical protein
MSNVRPPNMRTLQVFALAVLLLLVSVASQAAGDQAVIIHLRLSNGKFGSKAEVDKLFKLEQEIAAAVERTRVGEEDGNEIGEGEFIIFCYGPNGDRLFAVIEPILRKSVHAKGARVVIRYGEPGSRQRERLF